MAALRRPSHQPMKSIRNTLAAGALLAVVLTSGQALAGPSLSSRASESWQRASEQRQTAWQRGTAVRPGVRHAPRPGGGTVRVSPEQRELARIADALERMARSDQRRPTLREIGGTTPRR